MSAFHALRAARDAGVRIGVDGNTLTLDADAEPPATVLGLLSLHKSGVLALLRTGSDGWSGEDWLAWFDERAAIAEHDGGLPREDAESCAFACCITEWLNRNLERSPPGHCPGGGGERVYGELQPIGMEHTWHAGLCSRCLDAWLGNLKAEAVAALSSFGIWIRTSP